MSKDFLIVIDMQNDFVTGSLGSDDAKAITNNVVKAIETLGRNSEVVYTLDSHKAPYSNCAESVTVPVEHCVVDTPGWLLIPEVARFVKPNSIMVRKPTFAVENWDMLLATKLSDLDRDMDMSFTLCGLCTDICVVSNAVTLRASFPGKEIRVIADACAGTSPEAHEAALKVMQSIGVKVINAEDLA